MNRTHINRNISNPGAWEWAKVFYQIFRIQWFPNGLLFQGKVRSPLRCGSDSSPHSFLPQELLYFLVIVAGDALQNRLGMLTKKGR